MRSLLLAGALVLFVTVPSVASAYTLDTAFSAGCHESVTVDALRAVRENVPPIAPDDNERAMIDDLMFAVPDDLADLSGVSLLHGVRDNDLKGRTLLDVDQLAQIHGDPNGQVEHCLRRPTDDGPEGSRTALDGCRAYILDRALAAGDTLGKGGHPDPSRRMDLRVSLALRGRVLLRLPTFHVRIGQALHALQDSFTHSYRTPDGRRITVVLNWVDTVEDHADDARDGPPHASLLDDCDDADALRTRRHVLAVEASTALLRAVLRPGDRVARTKAVLEVLDTYMAYEPGCTAENGWCDAPERALADEAVGCGLARPGRWVPSFFFGVMVLGFVARRRRRVSRCASVAVVLACGLLFSRPAAAAHVEDIDPHEAWATHRPRLGVQANVGGSIDRTALAGSLGGRYRLDSRWLVGLDVEWNPWGSFNTGRLRPGALNIYATLARRWPLLAESFHLRSTVHLGTSTALFALYGVPAGSTGLYVGVNFLGLEWTISRTTSLLIDPADVAFPIPQLDGVPFGYLQYRCTLGVQYGG